MCNAAADIKRPFEQIAAQDSRNAADIFNKIGWQGAEDEAKHNVQNPGRAITKAAINAALWYLGDVGGSYLGSGSDAAGAAGSAAGSAATTAGPAASDALAASQAFGNMVTPTTQELAKQAIANVATQGGLSTGSSAAPGLLSSLSGGLDPETQAGMGGMGVAQNGIGPGSYINQLRGAVNNPSSLMSANGMPANLVNSLLSGGSGGSGSNLALQMGMKSLQPQQPQGPMPSRPPMPQQQQPLPMPQNTNSLNSGQNSISANLPPPGMSYAEWLRRKQMMGY